MTTVSQYRSVAFVRAAGEQVAAAEEAVRAADGDVDIEMTPASHYRSVAFMRAEIQDVEMTPA